MSFEPELMYFDIAGRAELPRVAFHYGGIKFTDTRVTGEKWAAMKDDTGCFGQLPVLTVGPNSALGQSIAIAQYAFEKR